MTWHIRYDGVTWQLSDQAVREKLTSDMIPTTALVWTEGMNEWKPASIVFGVEPEFLEVPLKVNSIKKSASIPLYIMALGLLIAAAVYSRIRQDFIIDFVSSRVGLTAAIALQLLMLVLVAFLFSIVTLKLWRHPKRIGASGAAGALFVLSVCASLALTINAGSFGFVATDIYRMKLAVDAWGDAEIRKSGDGRVTIIGPLGQHLMRDFTALDVTSGPVKIIEITSEGGLVDQALELAQQVELRRISVVVRQHCLSACILIAVASPESYADEEAVFGFHRTSPVADVETEIAEYAADQMGRNSLEFLSQHGVPQSILEEAAKHGPESVYIVSASKMVELGAISGIVSGETVTSVSPQQ
jgi:hypothetical protein